MPSAPAHWRQRVELSGKNILSVGIYAEVLARFLDWPEAVCAQGGVSVPDRGGYRVVIPDFVQALGRWPGSLLGTLEWSGVAQFPPHDTLTIYGNEGTVAYDFTTDEILLGRRGDSELKSVAVPAEFVRSWTVEDNFIEAVKQGGQPQPSFEVGVQYMKFTEAVNLSIADQKWVTIADL